MKILFFILFSLICIAQGESIYVSSETGNDESQLCGPCDPCLTLGRALNASLGFETVSIVVLPGEYNLTQQNLPLTLDGARRFSMTGQSNFPLCPNITQPTKAGHPILRGTLDLGKTRESLDVSISSVRWLPNHGEKKLVAVQTARLNGFALRNASLEAPLGIQILIEVSEKDNSTISFENNRYQAPDVIFYISAVEDVEAIQIAINSTTFSKSVHFDGPVLALNMTNSIIHQGRLAFNNTRLREPAVLFMTNCTFLNGTHLELAAANTTIRGSRFFPRTGTSSSDFVERNVAQSNTSSGFIDVRGNYWGDPSGPYSCCNPTSSGVFAIRTDSSSWCLDEWCTQLSSPIDPEVDYSQGAIYRSRWCENDTYCTAQGEKILFAIAGVLAGLFLICGIFVLISVIKYRRTVTSPVSAHIYSDSGFAVNEAPDTDSFRNRVIILLNVASILYSCLVAAAALVPAYIFPMSRITEPIDSLKDWNIIVAIVFVIVNALRVASNLWSIIIIGCGRPKYHTLMQNIMFSSIVFLYSFAWKSSSVINDIGGRGTYAAPRAPGQVDLPLSVTNIFTKYVWSLWLLSISSEILFALPALVMSINIIRKRDYSEVEYIRHSLNKHPSSSAKAIHHAPRLHRSFKLVAWLALASSVVFIVMITLLASVLGVSFGYARVWPLAADMKGVELAVLMFNLATKLSVFLNCGIICFFGFIIFRFRFYEQSFGYVYVTLVAGIAVTVIELGIFFAIEYWKRNDRTDMIISCILTFVALLLLCVPAGMSMRLLHRMRREMAPDIATSIYEQLVHDYFQ